jgi:type I restriction enzyme S subunit
MSKLPNSNNYVDSNIMWIGAYPSRWNLTQVKYEAYVKARVGWHGLKSDDFTDEGPYLVTGSDFKSTNISWSDCYHCDLKRYEQDPYIQLKNGDLLITKDGTIGKVALVQQLAINEKASLNSGVFVVRPLESNFLSGFYFWLLQSRVFTDFVDYNKTGSTIVHLYQDTFVNFSYASPKFKEQTQIAAFLDHETAKIDTLIDKQQQLIELLKEKRQAVISHAVTKGLDPDVPMKDSGVDWLGEVPEHWEQCSLSKLFDIKAGGDINLRLFSTLQSYDYPFPIYTNTNNEFAVYGYTCKANFLKNTITVTGRGDVGFAVFRDHDYDAIIRLLVLAPIKYIFCKFFTYFINEVINFKVESSAIGQLSTQQISPYKVVFPSFDEQHLIATFLDHETAKIDKLIDLQLQQIELLKERRTALISAAVTGKIDVRDWQTPSVTQTESDEVMA